MTQSAYALQKDKRILLSNEFEEASSSFLPAQAGCVHLLIHVIDLPASDNAQPTLSKLTARPVKWLLPVNAKRNIGKRLYIRYTGMVSFKVSLKLHYLVGRGLLAYYP